MRIHKGSAPFQNKFLPELIDQFDRAVDFCNLNCSRLKLGLLMSRQSNPQEARAKSVLAHQSL